MEELHAGFFECAVPLLVVARSAGRDDVLPDGFATPRSRHDVVQRQAPAGSPAVGAAPAVAGKECTAGDLALYRAWNPDIGDQPDHVWPGIGIRRGVQRLVELLDHLGLPLENEHVRATNGRHVKWLVARVQDENVLHLAGNVADGLTAVRRSSIGSTGHFRRTRRETLHVLGSAPQAVPRP